MQPVFRHFESMDLAHVLLVLGPAPEPCADPAARLFVDADLAVQQHRFMQLFIFFRLFMHLEGYVGSGVVAKRRSESLPALVYHAFCPF